MNSNKLAPIIISLLAISLILLLVFPTITQPISNLINQPAHPYDPTATYTGSDLLILAPRVMFTGGESAVTIAATDKGAPVEQSISFMLVDAAGVATTLTKGSTGPTGHAVATFDVPELEQGTYTLVAQPAGSNATFNGSVRIANSSALFLETDKPIYKPGQTIHGRILSLNNNLIPVSCQCIIEISDAKGIKIFKETLDTNEYGVASFDMPLASEVNLGTWKVKAEMGQAKTQLDLRVEKYVLPKFQVDVTTPRNWFLVDDPITGTVDANYFFGKQVEGRVSVVASRYVGVWEEYATYEVDLEDGSAEFELPEAGWVAGTYGAGGMGSLTLNISVTDTGNHTETTTKLLKITESPVVLQIIPESRLVKPGMPFNILIVTETPDGEPLEQEVEIELEFVDTNYNYQTQSSTVTTSNGVALAEFQAPEDVRSANIQASSGDASQSMNLGAVYSPSGSFLHLVQDGGGTPKVGDTISFIVYSTNPGTVYYDIVAGGRTVFSATSSERNISLTVTPQMSPKAKVVAYIINPNSEVSADTLPFDVIMEAPVDLQVSFDQDEVEPSGDVSVNFDAGSRSMIGYSIVDESVFALSEGRLNLQQVFNELEQRFMEPQAEAHPQYWTPVPMGAQDIIEDAGLQVLKSPNLEVPEQVHEPEVEGGMGKGGFFGDVMMVEEAMDAAAPMEGPVESATGVPQAESDSGLAEVERVRQFFPETWVWEPELITDDSGMAEVDLSAPDSITTWRLHAVSSSPDGFGIAETGLKVFQDFFVDPDLPYAVTRGEEFPVTVQVYNYLDKEQQVTVTLSGTNWFDIIGSSNSQISVPANSVQPVSFTIRPTQVGTQLVEITGQTTSRADAVKKEIIVEPEGTQREIVINGILQDQDVILDAVLPHGIVADSGKILLSFTPSLVAQSISGVDDLLGMPYGCGEQNMMFFAPDVEILRYLKTSGQTNPEIQAKAEMFIITGYQRQLTYQHRDGSFSAFGDSDPIGSLWLTAFVLQSFSSARDVTTIDDSVLDGAADWIMSNQNQDGSWDQIGFVHHQEILGGMSGKYSLSAYTALSLLEYGRASGPLDNAQEYLEDNLDDQQDDPYALALAALVLERMGSDRADDALDMLMDLAQQDENGMYWELEPSVEPRGMYWQPPSSKNVEVTAYGALVLIEHRDARANEVLKWLSAQRNSLGGYGSTQDTVLAFKALMTAAATQAKDTDATITVTADGKKITQVSVDAGNYDVLQIVEIPGSAELITLSISGKGDINYQLVKRFNVILPVEPVFTDLEFEVEYDATDVAVNDIVDVHARVNYTGRANSTGMLILDVAVPTGFAPVVSTLNELKTDGLISRYEIAGRKIILYVDDLPGGEELLFDLQVQAQFPVKAIIPDSSAYSYYNPEIKAESRGREIVVV
ncbi:MAG: alpha-2-macroglobulin [ANME-2 cluster archaeon]|nr:alpha-2-macroglobulin [ANME-2 cluster archaeon]MBC2702791.1 alpha-2-macroglobulin [ANME-2 cluster archaeon]MBC2706329.1 alpha-2-macroglobulin [ANME-2 cluster archaeon]MBC2763036.1 alpha-2-macroglobulin [ANME-2 cluster archaeon]